VAGIAAVLALFLSFFCWMLGIEDTLSPPHVPLTESRGTMRNAPSNFDKHTVNWSHQHCYADIRVPIISGVLSQLIKVGAISRMPTLGFSVRTLGGVCVVELVESAIQR